MIREHTSDLIMKVNEKIQVNLQLISLAWKGPYLVLQHHFKDRSCVRKE